MKRSKEYNVRMELPGTGARNTVTVRAMNPQQAMRYALNHWEQYYPCIQAVRAWVKK